MKIPEEKIELFIFVCALVVIGLTIIRPNLGQEQQSSINLVPKTQAQTYMGPLDRGPNFVPQENSSNARVSKLPILMYHHVGTPPAGADATYRGLTVLPTDFEAQIKWLSDQGYKSVSLEDIYLTSLGKFQMPKEPVVFTFDDGYKDVFQNAIPILKKYGYTGSFAIITGFVGSEQGSNVYASWSDIAQAHAAGNEIVSHTQNHFDGSNPKFSADYIFQNLSGSLTDLGARVGITTNILVYPYGHYSATYLAQARKAGFVMGVSVREGDMVNLDDLMETPRLRVYSDETLQRFEDIILHKISAPDSTEPASFQAAE